jgi:hypothetical protein
LLPGCRLGHVLGRWGVSSETAHPLGPIDQVIWSPKLDHLIEACRRLLCPRGACNLFIDSIEASLKVSRIAPVPLILAVALVLVMTLALVFGLALVTSP